MGALDIQRKAETQESTCDTPGRSGLRTSEAPPKGLTLNVSEGWSVQAMVNSRGEASLYVGSEQAASQTPVSWEHMRQLRAWIDAHDPERRATHEAQSQDGTKEPYWKKLPLDLRADVLETHYLTAKQCLEETARDRDMWRDGCREWTKVGTEARAKIAELEARVTDNPQSDLVEACRPDPPVKS